MSRRKLLIGASIAGHVALFTGVFVHGIWNLDRLEYESRFRSPIAVMTPPPAGGGTPEGAKVEKPRPQPPKQVVKEPRQPPPERPDDLTVTIEAPGSGGTGTGTGTGTGDGPVTGEPCDEARGDCGSEPVTLTLPDLPAPPPPPPVRDVDVTPEILRGLRIRGETAIHPPREVYDEMHAAGQHRATATIKLCLTEAGAVASVKLLRSTSYPAYDRKLVDAARGWIYRPFTVNGRPAPACGTVTFQYAMR